MPAIALSMIVEMTSLTPRVVRRMPAMPAHSGADDDGDDQRGEDVEEAGQERGAGERGGGVRRRGVYWPSTPMLNRPIRKPIAAATAER